MGTREKAVISNTESTPHCFAIKLFSWLIFAGVFLNLSQCKKLAFIAKKVLGTFFCSFYHWHYLFAAAHLSDRKNRANELKRGWHDRVVSGVWGVWHKFAERLIYISTNVITSRQWKSTTNSRRHTFNQLLSFPQAQTYYFLGFLLRNTFVSNQIGFLRIRRRVCCFAKCSSSQWLWRLHIFAAPSLCCWW